MQHDRVATFSHWIEDQSSRNRFFSGTFWFFFSKLGESEFVNALGLQHETNERAPLDTAAKVIFYKRSGRKVESTFWYLPIGRENIRVLFCLDKPSASLRCAYRLARKLRRNGSLFPIGHKVVERFISGFKSVETHVLRGVSYPSRPNEGGADINLRPGVASSFLAKLDEDKRVLKTARFRAPTGDGQELEFTVGRPGFISYHEGPFLPLLEAFRNRLTRSMLDSVRPFEHAAHHFVRFRFEEPLFGHTLNYANVLQALSRTPRTSIALLHANPYFHAVVTNYEDESEFDVYITEASTITVQAKGDTSAASFLRIQNGFTELFRDANVKIEQTPQFNLSELMEGRV